MNSNFLPNTPGIYGLMYISGLSNDTNRINDTVKVIVNVINSAAPLCEGFNPELFPPANWNIVFTGTNFWTRQLNSAFCSGLGSAQFNFYQASQGIQQQMITGNFTPTIGNLDSLIFYDAYATYQNEIDQLQVLSSSNGGTTWNSLITLNGGISGQLVTTPPQTNPFSPSCFQWKKQSISLPSGTNKIKFNSISAFGNNLYLDSICIEHLIGIKKNGKEIPAHFSLSQNYPNPFNPVTIINYELPFTNYVQLIVYDIQGRKIKVLVNEKQQAGSYRFEFDASILAGGVYFYKLTSGDFTKTKKMLLLK